MFKLWEKTPGYEPSYGQEEPFMTEYIVKSDKPAPAVVVCPGGGYGHLAEHEGGPVCEWLNSIGISAFWLRYRLTPYRHTYITNDALRAIRYVRYHAKDFNIDSDKIGILGFSAGGHLASSATVHYNDATLDEKDPVDSVSSRPDFSILCYPVISSDRKIAHFGSFNNLIGDEMTIELLDYYSNEKQVTEDTPPAFLWHTASDDGVPFDNSIVMAKALKEKNVSVEMHIYPEGRHGLGLAKGHYAEKWTKDCEDWIKNIILKSE